MRLLRKTDSLDLPVAMSSVKLADRLLVIGCADPQLIARLAVKAGLTGRACAVDASADLAAKAARIAEREGALIEAAEAPGWRVSHPADSFDIVVIRLVADTLSLPPGAGAEAHRVLRSGGRCVVIAGTRRGGLSSWFGSSGGLSDGAALERELQTAGFAAVRTLAAREGLLFVEGMKRVS